MYENPKLIRVGGVEEVILGITAGGSDIDGNYDVADFVFAEEVDMESPGTT